MSDNAWTSTKDTCIHAWVQTVKHTSILYCNEVESVHKHRINTQETTGLLHIYVSCGAI